MNSKTVDHDTPPSAEDYKLASGDNGVDQSWYLQENPDVAAAGMDPVIHYLVFGWREGRNPRSDFSTSGYLKANAEAARAQCNPLIHYLRHGGIKVAPERPQAARDFDSAKSDDGHDTATDPRLKRLLKHAQAFASDQPELPPVGTPRDFIDPERLAQLSATYPDIIECIARDTTPIPAEQNREDYNPGAHLSYWIGGFHDYRQTLRIAASHGVAKGRYLDFGGSTGRVFRHFALQTDNWDVWSCDFKLSSVNWCLRHFDRRVKAFPNTSTPSLPLEDNAFDLITAFSVFTHLDETELGWLLELRRLLRPGGIACLTIHDEQTWLNRHPLIESTLHRFRPDIAALPVLPKGKSVVTWRDDDPYNCNVFHAQDYVENVWGRFFEICERRSLWHGAQGVVVCRKQ